MLTVREAKPTDAAALVELRALMFAAMELPGVDDPHWRTPAHEWLASRLGNGAVAAFVAETASGEIVASALGQVRDGAPSPGNPQGLGGLVSNVVTTAEHRRKGHARACMRELLAWFRDETEVGQIQLFATGQGAELYEEFGFHRHDYPSMRLNVPR